MPEALPARALPQHAKDTAIQCLRAPYDDKAAETAQAYLKNPSFDWAAFAHLIAQERIVALIFDRAGSWQLFPESLAIRLRKNYLLTTWQNDLRLANLHEILLRFTAAGIPVLVLKGMALLVSVYAKKGLRPMGDIDLLVPFAAMERAQQILCSMGYRCAFPPQFPLSLQNEIAFQKNNHLETLIELHSSLFCQPHYLTPAEMDWFWANSVVVRKDQWAYRVLSPTAQILHLSAHLWLHHNGGSLVDFNDLHEVIRQSEAQIDWHELLKAGQTLDFVLPLQKVLPELVHDWQSPIPAEVLADLEKLRPSRREERKFSRMFWKRFTFLDVFYVEIASLPGWKLRFQYAWYKVFPQPDFMKAKYPVKHNYFLPLMYIYRWVSSLYQVKD